MRIPFTTSWTSKPAEETSLESTHARNWRWMAIASIVVLALALRLANLDSLGLANHYYAAAVKSMLQSWHNFFYVAAEPGGSVSVDKPPVGLWIQALSVGVFGVNTFGLLIPQILAGVLSVVVVYHLVRRSFGTLAGLLAALVLAITPVVVATDRNNTIDSTLILTLLLAAWAFIKATESARLRYLMLGAVMVGIGFNIKMLEAYLPLPAFIALYFLGAKEGFWRKVGKLALTGLVLLAVSLSWVLAVDLTPASQRPYVGSSTDNSELSLIIGYNGLERLLGMNRGPNTVAGLFSGSQGNPTGGFPPGIPDGRPDGRPGNLPNGLPPGVPGGGRNFPGGFNGGRPPGGGPGGGFAGSEQAGLLRLFTPPLSKEASWLLPFGLFGLLLLVFGAKLTWPVAKKHQAALVWGGWLVTAGIFFSVAQFFHEYYLSTLAPPLAALVGIGIAEVWHLRQQRPWLAGSLLLAAAAATLFLQYITARTFVRDLSWLWWVAGVCILGAAALLAANLAPQTFRRWLAVGGYGAIMAGLLITPGIWSVLTNLHSSDNQSLPAAYNGSSNGPVGMGRTQVNTSLLDFLQANTQNNTYLMAVPSSMQGADYILATGRPVLYMGGFMGQDQVLTPESLAQLVTSGSLRYIYWNGGQGARFGDGQAGSQANITGWVTSHCEAVQGYDTATHNTGAPDGITGGTGTDGFRGDQQVSLYDCAQ